MLSALLNVVLPVVIVAGVGVLMAKIFPIDANTLGKINLYALTAPLIFDSLRKTDVSLGQGMSLVVAYLVVTGVAAVLAWVCALRFSADARRAITASVILGNNGNFGLPIALLALGAPGLDQAVVIFVVQCVVMFSVGPLLLGSAGGVKAAVMNVAKLPVLWAIALGMFFKAADLRLPGGVESGVELLAAAAIPMVLLALGVQLGQSEKIHLTAPVLVAVGMRTIGVPLLSLGIGLALGLRGLELHSLVLAGAMPTAVNVFMLAREYGSDPDTAASTVALSTGLSILTIAIVISLF